MNITNAFGRRPRQVHGVREDGIGVDLIDLTDRTYPTKDTDYNSVKATRMAVIHDSALVHDMPKATRQYLQERGKTGICCESALCDKIQCTGQKLSLKRCSRVSSALTSYLRLLLTALFSAFRFAIVRQKCVLSDASREDRD